MVPRHGIDRLVASPCCHPDLSLESALALYADLGLRKFEAFTHWVASALDIHADPAAYRHVAAAHAMQFVSFHLPPVDGDPASFERSVEAARFAREVGASVVLFKADSRPRYIEAARPWLDAIEGLGLVPVVQNHAGSPITSLDDMGEVLDGIAEPRMQAVLEVGHFHTAGVPWRNACDRLGDRIALVHIKDQIGRQSVPFGAGEIDLPGLFRHLSSMGYTGDVVVEMEVEDRENTTRYLREAVDYLCTRCLEAHP